MINNLNLRELEELHKRLEEALEILNPDALSIPQLHERNSHQTIMLEYLSIDVMHRIMKKYQARRQP